MDSVSLHEFALKGAAEIDRVAANARQGKTPANDWSRSAAVQLDVALDQVVTAEDSKLFNIAHISDLHVYRRGSRFKSYAWAVLSRRGRY